MPFLSAEDIVVTFGGIQALSHVSLDIELGRVTGLIGPNGAGKTTLFNVLSGLQRPDHGRVMLEGRDISSLNTYSRARLGIARTFQRVETFASLSVRDNVLVAAEANPRWRRSKVMRHAAVDDIIGRIGIADVAGEVVANLSTGTARLVELARAVACSPKLLLLDEPSSGLNEHETAAMSAVLRTLADDGLAILLVEHDIPFVMGISSTIYVLDFGTIIAEGSPSEVQRDAGVQAAYLGNASSVAS